MAPRDFSSNIVARFRRAACGRVAIATGPIEELPQSAANVLFNKVGLMQGEFPILGSVVSLDDWLLITTSRVLSSHRGTITALDFVDIGGVNCDIDACARAGQQEVEQLEYISLWTFSGKELTLRVQSGGGYLGIMGVLNWITRANWREGRRKSKGGAEA